MSAYYTHFPVLSIMVLFLGAFLIIMFGGNKTVRKVIAFLAVSASLLMLCSLVPRVMLGGEIISYWLGERSVAGGYAIGIAIEVDALSLFFGLLVATAVFVACVYSFKYMEHDDNVR